jgi:hypothetical protein
VWKFINSLVFDKREYGQAQAKINEHRELLQGQIDPKKIDSLEKEIRSRASLQQKLIAEQKANEQEAARRTALPPEQPVAQTERSERPRHQRTPRENSSQRAASTTDQQPAVVQQAPSEDPEQNRICSHIEELIRQKDFVAAYRGISVYEELVRKHYGSDYTASLIKELETAIFKKHGETFLRDLKKDLKR